jgi:ribosomal protein S1
MLEHPKYAALGNEGAPGFNWDAYSEGWNGLSLKVNTKVKTKKNINEKIYSHEPYAQSLYNKMNKIRVENVKDIKKGVTLHVDNLIPAGNNKLMATVGNGASNIIVDLDKEGNFMKMLTNESGEAITTDQFSEYLKIPEFRDKVLSMDLSVKVGADTEKGSIWDGQVEQMTKEFKEQIEKNSRGYWAEVLSTNGGGFVVEVAKTIKAFMPGSMASNNKIDDYESLVGRTMEVMIESYSDRYGFVVSRKKYINKVRHRMVEPIRQELERNPDKLYRGKITGATQYGVFVELNEYVNGMLHKTLVSDSLREAMRNEQIQSGTEIDVYVHKVENGKVILSDVPLAEREAVIARREAEDSQEKSEHIAQKNVAEKVTASKK